LRKAEFGFFGVRVINLHAHTAPLRAIGQRR